MTCTHPITVWQQTEARLDIPAEAYYDLKKVCFHEVPGRIKIEIPCGHCLGCRLDHANMWATRIMCEAEQWKKCCVVSLTYNDNELRHDRWTGWNTLCPKDLTDFLKRLRYYEKGIEEWEHPIKGEIERPIRYFACGEYGRTGTRAPAGGNPHFHVVFFNWIPDDLEFYKFNKYNDAIYKSKKLQKIWGHGFCTVEELNYNTACYVARYVQKKAGIQPKKRKYTGIITPEERIDERNGQTYIHWKKEVLKPVEPQEPEFITMSRGVGIGRVYWDKNKEKIKRNSGIMLKIKDKVKIKQIPRFYKKLWEKENYVEYYRWKYERSKLGEKMKAEIIAMVTLPDGTTEAEKYEFYLKNLEESLKEKAQHKLIRNNFV